MGEGLRVSVSHHELPVPLLVFCRRPQKISFPEECGGGWGCYLKALIGLPYLRKGQPGGCSREKRHGKSLGRMTAWLLLWSGGGFGR